MKCASRTPCASEKTLILIIVLGQIFLAPILKDFFPFSTFPMFSDLPQSLFIVQPGEGIRERDFLKIQNAIAPYLANPSPRLSRAMPRISAREIDRMWVINYLRGADRDSVLEGTIHRLQVGPLNDRHVGIVARDIWRLAGK